MFTTTKSKNGENYKSNNTRNLKDKTITETERKAKTKKSAKVCRENDRNYSFRMNTIQQMNEKMGQIRDL